MARVNVNVETEADENEWTDEDTEWTARKDAAERAGWAAFSAAEKAGSSKEECFEAERLAYRQAGPTHLNFQ